MLSSVCTMYLDMCFSPKLKRFKKSSLNSEMNMSFCCAHCFLFNLASSYKIGSTFDKRLFWVKHS